VFQSAGLVGGRVGADLGPPLDGDDDQQKNITITGIVARVELKNPHSLFYITVTDKDGKQVDWTLECQPLATLSTYGWSQTTMKVGDKVTAVGSPARNGSPAMLVRAIQLPDGRSIRT
jgi:uncharacterized protein DUF6152